MPLVVLAACQSGVSSGQSKASISTSAETTAGTTESETASLAQALIQAGVLNAVQRRRSLCHRARRKPLRPPRRKGCSAPDFLRDLSVSYLKLGALLRDLGQGDSARDFFQKALAIAEQLVRQEPGRADFQNDLAISHERMGDLAADSSQTATARRHFAQALQIRETLVQREPGRADFEAALVVPLARLGDRASLMRALDIVRRLEAEGRFTAQRSGWRAGLERMLSQL